MDQYGKLHLTIEPAGGLQAGEILTLNLGEMYQALNADTQILPPTPTPALKSGAQILSTPTPQVTP